MSFGIGFSSKIRINNIPNLINPPMKTYRKFIKTVGTGAAGLDLASFFP